MERARALPDAAARWAKASWSSTRQRPCSPSWSPPTTSGSTPPAALVVLALGAASGSPSPHDYAGHPVDRRRRTAPNLILSRERRVGASHTGNRGCAPQSVRHRQAGSSGASAPSSTPSWRGGRRSTPTWSSPSPPCATSSWPAGSACGRRSATGPSSAPAAAPGTPGDRRRRRPRAAAHVRPRARRHHGRLGHPAGHRHHPRPVRGRHALDGWRGEARRFGEGVAILVGDLAFVYADRLLAGAPPAAGEVFTELRIEVNIGQYLDLLGTARGRVTEDAARRICRFKSGKYTVERPAAPRRRPRRPPRRPGRAALRLRPAPGRGVPAPRRPARRVRRRRRHRQAGRRGSPGGQAHPALRHGRGGRRRPEPRSSPATAPPTSTTTTSPPCRTSCDTGAVEHRREPHRPAGGRGGRGPRRRR